MGGNLNYGPEMTAAIPNIFDVRRDTCFAMLTLCTPAIVQDVDDNGNVYVLPLIKKIYVDGADSERQVIKTTLATFQHGNFYLKAPVYIGDTGWLFSSDGDTAKVKSNNAQVLEQNIEPGALDNNGKLIGNGGPQKPDLPRVHHSYSHGFFLPDKWGGVPMPDEFKNSFVIETVKGIKDSDSKGRFVMDPDGTIRIFSTRWYDGNEKDPTKRLKSGSVIVDLKWYGKASPLEKKPTWKLGDLTIDANSLLQGDVRIKPWTDPEGKKHGGNLQVEGEGRFGPYLGTNGKLVADGDLKVGGRSNFGKKMVIKEDNKSCIIDPKLDLHKTDAKFREIAVLTGLAHDKNGKNKVALQVQKMRALVDMPEDDDPIEFEVGGGGGGGVDTDLHSIEFDKDNKLRLAAFQGTSRDLDTTLEENVNEAVEANSEISQEILVRQENSEEIQKLHYQKIGKLVTGLTDDSGIEKGQGVVQITHDVVDTSKDPYISVTLKPTAPGANTKKLELSLNNIPDGGSAIPDDTSINFNSKNPKELQIYRWDKAENDPQEPRPISPTNLDEDIRADIEPGDEIVVRDSEGRLKYKKIWTGESPMKDLTLNGEAVSGGVKVYASKAIDITQKKLIEGDNITLTESNNEITISAAGTETSGFSGQKTVIVEAVDDPDNQRIIFHREVWVYNKGLLKSVSAIADSYINTTPYSVGG